MSARRRRLLDDEQRLAWLRLIRSDNVGPATFRDLLNHYGAASVAIEALPELARRGGVAARIRVTTRAEAEREMEAALRIGARFVAPGEAGYPGVLAHLEPPAPLLCVRGGLDAAAQPAVGIVGSRAASAAGLKLAGRFARELGAAGFTVVSGLARGVDAAAHDAAIATGTLAMMAGGVDVIYPPDNAALAERIVGSQGALVSEMPLGFRPRAQDFPRRNRLIAGAGTGVLVIEAARRSGSLITARLANEMGRHVFAVPGSPLDPRAEGTNHLIKQGAALVTEPADILDALRPGLSRAPDRLFEPEELPLWETGAREPSSPSEDARKRVLGLLGPAPIELDDLIRMSGLDVSETQLAVLELDLAGRIERHPGNRLSLTD